MNTYISAIFLLCSFVGANAQRINGILDSLQITPITISFHPEGEVLLSTTRDNKENKQYLLVVSLLENETIEMDTIPVNRPNRSTFSRDGKYVVHNTKDTVTGEWDTVKRRYYGKGKVGSPIMLSDELLADGMFYYYFMDENEDFYYYRFVREHRPDGGLLYAAFQNGRYKKPEMIHPDRPNAVAYSPYLLDGNTMIFAQHGIEDDTYRGIHFSIKDNNGHWSEPTLLKNIPMCNVITHYNDDKVAFLRASDNRIFVIAKNELFKIINKDG